MHNVYGPRQQFCCIERILLASFLQWHWTPIMLIVNDKNRFHLRYCNYGSFSLSIPITQEVGFCVCVEFIRQQPFLGKNRPLKFCFVGCFFFLVVFPSGLFKE